MWEVWAEYVIGEKDYYLLETVNNYNEAVDVIEFFVTVTGGAHAFWKEV